ncbi:hypothetical protein Syun_016465 [Stephania yunnanensis]|uniref:Uncharacterized protein n=1 Tax=Stephania yunnanensis TaxID=152371 RepID=A0AAP0J7C4_9MAGN
MQTGEHFSFSQQQYDKFPHKKIVQPRPLEAAMEDSDDDQVQTILTELLHESEEWLRRAIVKYQERCLKKLKGTDEEDFRRRAMVKVLKRLHRVVVRHNYKGSQEGLSVKVKAQKMRRNLSVGSPKVTSRGLEGEEEELKVERFMIKTPNLVVVKEEDHGTAKKSW